MRKLEQLEPSPDPHFHRLDSVCFCIQCERPDAIREQNQEISELHCRRMVPEVSKRTRQSDTNQCVIAKDTKGLKWRIYLAVAQVDRKGLQVPARTFTEEGSLSTQFPPF